MRILGINAGFRTLGGQTTETSLDKNELVYKYLIVGNLSKD